jgi:hypothetical protein
VSEIEVLPFFRNVSEGRVSYKETGPPGTNLAILEFTTLPRQISGFLTVNTTALFNFTVIDFAFNGLTIFGGRTDVVAFGCTKVVSVSELLAVLKPFRAREKDRIEIKESRTSNRRICNLKS